MKRKFYFALIALFLFPLSIIKEAYSIYNFGQAENEVHVEQNGIIDDVKPNYMLDENIYTVYFFAQKDMASWISSSSSFSEETLDSLLEEHSSSIGEESGYWEDLGDSQVGIAKNKFGYKKLTMVDTSISIEQFNGIGEPTTTSKDKYGYPILFTGWTADINSAINYGFATQGNYNYISAFDDLGKIDVQDINGSPSADKVIFVYPIYTSGKNYNASKQETAVRLHNEKAVTISTKSGTDTIFESELYFSQKGEDNSSYYFYNNLTIGKNDVYYLDFGVSVYSSYSWGWSGTWWNFYDGKNSKTNVGNCKALLSGKATSNAEIKGEGTYNIYVYVLNRSYNSYNRSSDFSSINRSSRPLVYYQDPDNNSYSGQITSFSDGNSFSAYVKVEKIYDFALIGANNPFSFSSGAEFHSCFKNLDVTDSSLSGLWNIYMVDNVYIDGALNPSFMSFGNYSVKRNVFGVLTSSNDISSFKIGKLNSNFLTYLKKEEGKTFYTIDDSDNNGTVFSSDVTASDFLNKENLPCGYPSSTNGYFFNTKTNHGNYYSIAIKVDFSQEDGSISNISIALSPHVIDSYLIYIYKEGTIFSKTDGFIDIDVTSASFYGYMEIKANSRLDNDSIVYIKQNEDGTSYTKYNFSKLLENSYCLIDHLNNKEIGVGKNIKRHIVCYLKLKP